MDTQSAPSSNLSIPIAIIAAGALIALAVYFVGDSPATGSTPQPTKVEMPPVTAADHILGSPEALITIVEYSDLDCPFCKQFHATMKQIIAEYGSDGRVAWVYRNFPLAQLHPNAPQLAEASECVASLAGNDAYWKFLDVLFREAPGNERTDVSQLPTYAAEVGVKPADFSSCMSSGKFKSLVEQQFNDAIGSGGQGTPHNLLVTRSGSIIPIAGAQPYANIKAAIEAALGN